MSQDRPGDDHDQGKESETSSTQTATTADLTPTPYETIFNAIEDAAFVFDVSHDGDEVAFTFLENNPAHESLTGMTTEDYRGQTPRDFLDDKQAAEVIDNYRTCVERRETIEYEETLEHPSGVIEWETKLTPIIQDKTVTQIVGVARDITDRKEREQALQRRDEFLQHSSDITLLLDEERIVRYQSHTEQDVFGYETRDLTGDAPLEYVHPDDQERVQEAFQTLFDHPDETAITEFRFQTPGGTWRWYESRARNLLDDPIIDGILVTVRDITDQKEYERELAAERDFLDKVIESLPYPFYVLNVEDYTVEHVNSQADLQAGQTCYEITHQREQPCDEGDDPIPCPLSEVTETEEPYAVEHVHVVDGEERVFSVQASPIFDADGNVTQIAESNIDITERIEYETRLEQQRDDLQLLNEVVRHDIRNDLTVIKGYAELLTAYVDDDAKSELETVQEKAEEAIDLTTTARDLAKVMLQPEVKTKELSLAQTLRAQIEEIRSGYPEATVTIEGTLPNSSIQASEMLEAVFRNLLGNAIQHNNKAEPEVVVTAMESDDAVNVQIADNGPGIPDSRKDEVFARGAKGLESAGSGIGLYLVETVVTRYGGDVWVEDNDPEGSVFIVELPKAS